MTSETATQKINAGYEKAVSEASFAASDGSTPAWTRWLPQLKEAVNEHNKALAALEMAERELSRICYVIQRDKENGRNK